MSASRLFSSIVLIGVGCAHKAPDAADRAQFAQWEQMVTSVRDEGALRELRARARAGVVEAERALGRALSGQKEAALRREGIGWVEQAAQAHDRESLLVLGKIEFFGAPELPISYDRARGHLGEAAKLGEPRAEFYLGLIAKNGYAGPPDHALAAKHFEKAAEHEIAPAMFLLANAYREGDGVPKDDARALSFLRQSAELDHPPAIQALAMAYRNGELGLSPDPELADREQAELAHALREPQPLP